MSHCPFSQCVERGLTKAITFCMRLSRLLRRSLTPLNSASTCAIVRLVALPAACSSYVVFGERSSWWRDRFFTVSRAASELSWRNMTCFEILCRPVNDSLSWLNPSAFCSVVRRVLACYKGCVQSQSLQILLIDPTLRYSCVPTVGLVSRRTNSVDRV